MAMLDFYTAPSNILHFTLNIWEIFSSCGAVYVLVPLAKLG